MSVKKNDKIKLIAVLVAIVAIISILYRMGIFEIISIENIQKLKTWIDGFGVLGPVVYIGIYIAGALFFLPGIPLALLAGIAFGPVMGGLWALTGATIGATAACFVARYAARAMVEGWAQKNTAFKKIDEGVEKQGWRMLMITRLVPVFPYNIQNYAYGLTKINIVTFFLVSFVCMAPGAFAFTFMSGAIVAGESPAQIMMYLAIGAILFVIASLIPGYLKKKRNQEIA